MRCLATAGQTCLQCRIIIERWFYRRRGRIDMTKITRRTFAASTAAAAAVAGLGLKPASAQAYPSRPVTVIVPWGAGGGTDAKIGRASCREGRGCGVGDVHGCE